MTRTLQTSGFLFCSHPTQDSAEDTSCREDQKKQQRPQRMIRTAQLVIAVTILEGFLSQEIQVFQVPEVSVFSGSDVTLPCTYNVSGGENTTIGSYKWYKHLVKIGPEVSDSNKDFTGRISRADTEQFIKIRSAPLTIHNVDATDTGTYYCTVSIIDGGEKSGSGAGTLLHVTEQISDTDNYSSIFTYLGAVFGVVIVVFLLVGFYRFSKQAPRSTGNTAPIIYTEFNLQGSRQCGSCGPELQQNMEISHYMMENQQYNEFLPVSSTNHEENTYSFIP